MADYQILYWQYIPLTIKATDGNDIVRHTLLGRFEAALKQATSDYRGAIHSTELRWGHVQKRPGSAAEVALIVAEELDREWNEAGARALFNKGDLQSI